MSHIVLELHFPLTKQTLKLANKWAKVITVFGSGKDSLISARHIHFEFN